MTLSNDIKRNGKREFDGQALVTEDGTKQKTNWMETRSESRKRGTMQVGGRSDLHPADKVDKKQDAVLGKARRVHCITRT